MAKSSDEPLTLEFDFADGQGEIEVDLMHPLVSAFRRAVQTGRPTGQWMYLIARPTQGESPRLLGTVVWTPGSRFLFFSGRLGEVYSVVPPDALNGKLLDHATLQLPMDMTSFDEHIAVFGAGKNRGRRRRGKVHDGFLHPWFSLINHTLDHYVPIPKTLRCSFVAPTSDVERRCRAMMDQGLRANLCFPEPGPVAPTYFQLDVWAGRGLGWNQKHYEAIPWPSPSGVISGHLGETCNHVMQHHSFGGDNGVVTVLTRPSGKPVLGGLVHAAIEPKADLG